MRAAALAWFKRDLRLRDHAPLAEALHFERALGLVVIEPACGWPAPSATRAMSASCWTA